MKTSSAICLLIASFAALVGCSSAPPAAHNATDTSSQLATCKGSASIEAYCATHTCPSFEEAAAAARRPQPPGALYRYAIGTCGAYHFVRTQSGPGLGIDYFDEQGRLIASSSVADTEQCDGEFSSISGRAPKCEERILEQRDDSLETR